MDVTVSGVITLKGNEEAVEKMNYFVEGDFGEEEDDDEQVSYRMFNHFEEADFAINGEYMELSIDQSYEFIETTDYSSDIFEFMKELVKEVPGLSEAKFEGWFESWSSGEFIKFLCKYSGNDLVFYESEIYDNSDEEDVVLNKREDLVV